MPETNKSTTIEQIAANVINTRFENFDQNTIDFTKSRIIDTVGCLIGGANAAGNSGLINLIRNSGGCEEATILVHGFKSSINNAALVNCIMARSYDFEPVSPMVEGKFWPGHISGTTIPTAITIGEAKDINGRELMEALLAGDDLATRILASCGFKFDAGWDNIGTINAFGATAIAGKLLGLDQRQMRNALGIVLNQLAGTLQNVWDKTTSFKICNGLSARNGIFAAQLAQAGWTGPQDALFGKFGYFNLYTSGCSNPQVLTDNLGRKYYSDGTIKPYPCCRNNHAAIDCALALVNKNNINPEDIREVILYVSPEGLNGFCGGPFIIGDFPQANAIWSYRYVVATALLKKSLKPEHFTEEAIRNTQVNNLAAQMKLAELPGADLYTARLEVTLNNGEKLTKSTNSPKGDRTSHPLSKSEIIDKFWQNVSFSQTVSSKNAQKLLDLLENLENLDCMRQIVNLLVVK